MNRQVKKENAGFSLLEVVLAIAILALISIPMLNYFADSMKYSVLTAKQQKATILAQQVVEDLEAQSRLIAIPSGGVEYTIDYLDNKTGYTLTENLLDTQGKGSIAYQGEEGNYDVTLKISTDVAANDVSRPVIYGIDDTTDVLAVEREQKQEAVAYFMAINSAHVSANGGTALTRSQLEAKLSRVMRIEIDADGTNYRVQVYYDYDCIDLRGAGSSDSWTGTALLDVKVADLKNIYLLYDRMTGANDTLKMNSTVSGVIPDLYLVCQNPVTDSGYRLSVERLSILQVIHSNISNTAVGGQTGMITDDSGNAITDVKPLTDSDKPVRLLNIHVEIYEKGHSAGDAPLATVDTTKGE